MYQSVFAITFTLLLSLFPAGCIDPDASVDPTAELARRRISTASTCAIGQWCSEMPTPPLDTALTLFGVWAVNAGDVFAVGDMGTILRRINGDWQVMASGTTNSLRGVWALSSSNVWAVGAGGTILRFDGTTWTTVTGVVRTDINLAAVWGSSANDVWLAGGTSVWHWDGTSFSLPTAFTGSLTSLSGTGPTDVWLAGENSNLHHFDGAKWTSVAPLPGTSSFFAVLAISTTDAWATDFVAGKESVHWNGSKWVPVKTNGVFGTGIFKGLSALAANDIWGAGGNSIGHWDGTAWTTTQPFGTNVSLWSVTATTGNVWVVGNGALIRHQSL
jgi:hypothetical protein